MLTKSTTRPELLADRLNQTTAANRFKLNLTSNIVYVGLSTALMLWYVPFLIERLGVAAYGMVPLANSLVMFTVILSSSLDTSINRFFALDLNRGDIASANRTFNTALGLSLLACLVLLVPGLAMVWFFPTLFQVPAGYEQQTRLLFATVLFTSLTAILSANFAVSSLVFHRFDLRNLVRSAAVLIRVGLVVICFTLMPPQLWHVAAGFAAAAVVGLVGDVLVWRSLTPFVRVRPADIQRTRMRELLGLSGWAVVNQVGVLLLMQADLAIVNNLFGPVVTGVYGSLLLFPQLIQTLMETVTSILSPAILGAYARGDVRELWQLASRSVRLLGLALALPIGLLSGLGAVLLELWLGPEFGEYHLLLVVLVAHLIFNLATRPLGYVLTAYNKVRIQGLVTLALGVLNVGLALALAWWAGWGVIGVAAASAIIWTIRSVLFLSSYTAHVMRLPYTTFTTSLIPGAVMGLGVGLGGWALTLVWWPAGWLELGLAAALVTLVYLAITYTVALTPDDRSLLRSQLLRGRPGA